MIQFCLFNIIQVQLDFQSLSAELFRGWAVAKVTKIKVGLNVLFTAIQ